MRAKNGAFFGHSPRRQLSDDVFGMFVKFIEHDLGLSEVAARSIL